MSDKLQLLILMGISVLIFAGTLLAVVVNRLRRTYSPDSARFITATALRNLSKKIEHVAAPGVEVLMPAGYGLYPLTLTPRERARMENQIEKWVRSGILYSVIISAPNDEARSYWQRLVDKFPPTFKVFMLDRMKASQEDAIDIQRLDRFHPTLIVKGEQPLGMWLESIHEKRSRVAYNVEYVAARDIIDLQFERFSRLLKVLRRLTDEVRRPLFLTLLRKSGETPNLHAASSAA